MDKKFVGKRYKRKFEKDVITIIDEYPDPKNDYFLRLEYKKEDGNIFSIMEKTFKEFVLTKSWVQIKTKKLKRKKEKFSYAREFKGNLDFWEFIRYLSHYGTIGGFQAVPSKVDNFKTSYFDATGEELKEDDFYLIKNPNTWGNEMRIYFIPPQNTTIDEIDRLLPGDVQVKDDGDKWNISRIPFILELLAYGFRLGTKHNLEMIEESIKLWEEK